MLKTYDIYKKLYIINLRLGYEKPAAFALRVSVLDLVAFVRLSLFKTKLPIITRQKRCIRDVFVRKPVSIYVRLYVFN
ncbi:hypothetical protein Hanom_Chr03g00256591 [Helianthus anomalus]